MSFINHFSELEDGRTDINICHDLLDVVFLAVTAMLSGAQGWKDIQLFGEAKLEWLRQHRRFEAGIARRHTIARIISAIRPESLLECFVGWVNEVRGASGKCQIAIDGKTLRRSHPGDKGKALHLLSARVVESGLLIYQRPSEGKKNEIRTVQQLLDILELEGACVTLDAMHCQRETVKQIRRRSADYVIQVKANQKQRHDEIRAFFHKTRRDEPQRIEAGQFETLDKGHGRIEQRRHVQLEATDWLESASRWKGLSSVVEVTRKVHSGDQEREETSYYITSLSTDTASLAGKIRRHWHIENGQHRVLDATCGEDDSRIRTGDAPQNMALFRRFVLNLARLSPLKESMKGKLKRAAWSDSFRSKLLFG